MRKEVKQGFAIGGVLLSVLIVYVLVISGGGGEKPQPVSLATSDTSNSAEKPTTPPAGSAPAASETPKPVDSKPADESAKKDSASAAAPAPTTEPAQASGDPFKSDVSTSSGPEPWAHGVLQTGELPVMMTSTPQRTSTITPIVASTSGDNGSAAAAEPSTATPSHPVPAAANAPEAISPTATPVSQPPRSDASIAGKPRTHVVQSGETFASIAAMVYGNASYYAHLMRANPGVDPKKMRPGTVITIPPDNDVKAEHSVAMSGAPTTTASKAVDTRTQYVVQPGETLMRIAVKLYGKATRADQLYDLNRGMIGSDPNKLKPGMVLKLPEAPTLAKSQ